MMRLNILPNKPSLHKCQLKPIQIIWQTAKCELTFIRLLKCKRKSWKCISLACMTCCKCLHGLHHNVVKKKGNKNDHKKQSKISFMLVTVKNVDLMVLLEPATFHKFNPPVSFYPQWHISQHFDLPVKLHCHQLQTMCVSC